MNARNVLLGTIGYTVSTFILAVTWHVVLFKPQYQAFGYFDGEPDFLVGLAAIVIQGAILSALFPLVQLAGSAVARGLKFAAIAGLFFWTSHVLALVAKQTVANASVFILMESVYLVLQFGLFGLILGLVNRSTPGASD